MTDLSPSRLLELKGLASKATPGERIAELARGRWLYRIRTNAKNARSIAYIGRRIAHTVQEAQRHDTELTADAQLIAALSPHTVTAMVEEIERLREMEESYADAKNARTPA
jgi:hypothetical protein